MHERRRVRSDRDGRPRRGKVSRIEVGRRRRPPGIKLAGGIEESCVAELRAREKIRRQQRGVVTALEGGRRGERDGEDAEARGKRVFERDPRSPILRYCRRRVQETNSRVSSLSVINRTYINMAVEKEKRAERMENG